MEFKPVKGPLAKLSLLSISASGGILQVQLARPEKRNAINDTLIGQIQQAFTQLPSDTGVVLLTAAGDHFCAGLDLSSLRDTTIFEGVQHSRMWHSVMDCVQFARVPVVAVLKGAVVGGGLELAASAHLRIAEDSTFYGLPEGQRGLFVGGGGSARVPKLIGFSRMTDMMLTGRVYNAEEGQAIGLSHYRAGVGAGLAKGIEVAARIAGNAPLSNYAILQALPRIAEMPQQHGLFVESLIASISQGDDAAKSRMKAFLEGRADKVLKK